MADSNDDLKMLDALFDQARQERPELPGGVSARILSDAAACQAEQRASARGQGSVAATGASGAAALRLWEQFRRAVGGWPAMGGMVAAGAVGLWIGLAPPAFLPDPVELVQASTDTVSMPYESYDLAMLLDEEMQ